MVPARIPDLCDHGAPADFPASAVGGFGKVLNSIHGLQQRLDDFSLEEAHLAETKSHALIQKLKALHAQLTLVEKLRSTVADTQRIVEAMPEVDFAPIAPDGLEHHSGLRAIVQAGKLIRNFRLLQVARASMETVALDFDPTVQAPPTRACGEQRPEPGSLAIAQPPIVGAANPPLDGPPISAPLDKPTPAAELMLAGDLGASREAPTEPLPENHAVNADVASAGCDGSDAKSEDCTQLAVRPSPSAPAKAAATGARSTAIDNNADKSGPIDQRLLNELIDTYGEFVAVSSGSQANEHAAVAPTSLPALPDMSNPLPAVSSAALVPVQAVSLAQRAQPPAEALEASPGKKFAPSIKNHAEVDRQLKRIIKDYGEYDLYAHAKPSNLNKTALIVAFAALVGLLLGGIFLFQSQQPRTPAALESHAPAQVIGIAPSNLEPASTEPKNEQNWR